MAQVPVGELATVVNVGESTTIYLLNRCCGATQDMARLETLEMGPHKKRDCRVPGFR